MMGKKGSNLQRMNLKTNANSGKEYARHAAEMTTPLREQLMKPFTCSTLYNQINYSVNE